MENERQAIVRVCRQLYDQGVLAACDGNVSMRVSPSQILITSSGVHKGFLDPETLSQVTLDGQILSGKPSSELAMHLTVYRLNPQANAVVHAHPPAAIAWTIAFPEYSELPGECLSELILAVGRVPIVPYCLPGSPELSAALAPHVADHRVCLLSRHGCLCWGETLNEAFWGVERLEHAAKTLAYAQSLGGLTFLSPDQVDALRHLRTKIGDRVL